MFEEVEGRFGDGTHGIVQQVAALAVPYFPSVRRFLMRPLPVRVLADMVPAVYLREFDHGRMEVETAEGRAHLKQFDWPSSPARCKVWLGTYEGAFSHRRARAKVWNVECLLKGDEYCGYVVEWTE